MRRLWPGLGAWRRAARCLAAPFTGRPLTPAEIAMVRELFGGSIQCERVKVYRRRFLPCTGGNAMTPFGAIYFPSAAHCDDFSQADDGSKVWFMHEMAHVWQYQQGLCVVCHGLRLGVRGGYGRHARAYAYDPGVHQARRLQDFNMEQQAELLSHYFDARFLDGRTGPCHERRVRLLPFYEAVLADFLCQPGDPRLLARSGSHGRGLAA